ncbi:GNAT family N-acetyltransferase [Natrononativus amylolyticus]|uniref:GNAT family N-acetyltransferase n=1 Tax=Natrononativus amylolyticus TaxID=2963434 RepID=UPI0020CE22C3|nr:GNAT family N-acetyltransferase [Natrononativus amylolyticus]
MAAGLEIRRATHDDYEAVKSVSETVWPDHGGDYLHRVYHDWLEDADDDTKRTFVADAGDELAGIVQAVMLSPEEAWFQGMRVNADYRRQGVSTRLNDACFEWARDQGATVGRIMTYSWNVAALGAARAGGFEPVTEFRWAQPDPDPDADGPLPVSNDPAAAWRYWADSPARDHLRGVALSPEESWAVCELTREILATVGEETAVFAVHGDDGVAGASYRTREYERRTDDGAIVTWVEYGVGAWDGLEAARSLFAAIARDAATLGADRVRVLIPETVGFVSDASLVAEGISEEPDFVLGIDLTEA